MKYNPTLQALVDAVDAATTALENYKDGFWYYSVYWTNAGYEVSTHNNIELMILSMYESPNSVMGYTNNDVDDYTQPEEIRLSIKYTETITGIKEDAMRNAIVKFINYTIHHNLAIA